MKPHPPLATLALVAAVVATFGLELSAGVEPFCQAHGFDGSNPSAASLVASMLLHASWAHLLGNLAVLLVAGSLVERSIGSLRFLALFVAGGIAGAVLHCFVDSSILVGCSGSLFAVLAVASTLYGAPVLAFTAVLAAVNIAHAFGLSGDAGVSFAAHCGGLFVGAAVVVLARLRGVDMHRGIANRVTA